MAETVRGAVDGPGDTVGDTVGGAVDGAVDGVDTSGLLDGNLLNVDVNLDADAGLTAPIAGAVAANANVAAPIDAAVAANIGSVDSDAVAISQQDAIITQDITGSAEATTAQESVIGQGDPAPADPAPADPTPADRAPAEPAPAEPIDAAHAANNATDSGGNAQ